MSSPTTSDAPAAPHRPAIDLIGLVALVLGACAMGISPLFVRFASDAGVPAFASAFWRVALALPVLWIWAVLEEKRAGKGSRPTMNRAILLAGCLFAGDLLLWHIAILNTTIANATFLGTTTPIWVVLVSWLVYREKIPAAVPLGIIFCVLGGFALIGRSIELDPNHVKGDLFALGTAVFFGLYFFAVQSTRKYAGAARATFGMSLIAAPIILVFALVNGDVLLPEKSSGYSALFALALISHTGGQGLLAIALGRLPTVFTSFVIFIEAFAAALAGWIYLNEALSGLQLLGGAAILAGIWVARPKNAKSSPEVSDETSKAS
jgi:drug/metabolite transporter (DMT)-like permease